MAKKIVYTLDQITDAIRLLNKLEVKGLNQAKYLSLIGVVLDGGVELSESEESKEE